MKRIFLITASVLALSLTVKAADPAEATPEICKKGDIKDCANVLKGKVDKPEEFASTYEDICVANKTFKCVKVVVRGDVNDEMKYQKQDHPKATMFHVKLDTEEKIFMLEKK